MRSLTLGEERLCEAQVKAGEGLVRLLRTPRRAGRVQLEPSQPALHLQSPSRNCPAPGAPEGGQASLLSPQALTQLLVLGPTPCSSDTGFLQGAALTSPAASCRSQMATSFSRAGPGSPYCALRVRVPQGQGPVGSSMCCRKGQTRTWLHTTPLTHLWLWTCQRGSRPTRESRVHPGMGDQSPPFPEPHFLICVKGESSLPGREEDVRAEA